MLIKRSDVQKPTLPQEVVPVPELGGEVLVRGMDFAGRQHLQARCTDKADDASRKFAHMAVLLEFCVLDADGEPIFNHKEWNVWGVQNETSFWKLWNVAFRLSDLDGKEAEKNSKAPTSD